MYFASLLDMIPMPSCLRVHFTFLLIVLIWRGTSFADTETESEKTIPQIDDSGWWQVAGNPDLGELTGEKQAPVDFAIWQAADSTWQLWSCIRDTKEAGVTRLFYRWEGQKLTDSDWEPKGIAMRGDPNYGERLGGMQAPYVIKLDGEFLMFYGDWVNICLATSRDGKIFERASINGKGPQLFTEGDGNNARDPMLVNVHGAWNCYYSAMPDELGAIFVRQSKELRDWSKSKAKKVVSGGVPGKMWYQAECPHVVFHKGYYFLFRTSDYYGKPKTTVYRSKDPLDFGIDDDSKTVTTLPVAAPEVIRNEGKLYLAALNPRLDGIRITTLEFVPEP